MKWGIEFEYLLIDTAPSTFGRVRDFTNLVFEDMRRILAEKPGRNDSAMATGDLGIRTGYWYLEGDERFDDSGQFRTLKVKGVEVRTPPRSTVGDACEELLAIEQQLAEKLAPHDLGLAIVGFNPVRCSYDFDPPLNAWETKLRRVDRGYDGSLVSTLSYGPDINLSNDSWSMQQLRDNARKLNWYAPYIVPFSFSSPFFGSAPWNGWSVRTHKRAPLRPAVRYFCDPLQHEALWQTSSLVHPARLASEVGRLEFKAFDAITCVERLRACCHLLHGLCLDRELEERSETTDLMLCERACRRAFDDPLIFEGAKRVIAAASRALLREGHREACESLGLLESSLWRKRTPAHGMLAAFKETGLTYRPGGLRLRPALIRCLSKGA